MNRRSGPASGGINSALIFRQQSYLSQRDNTINNMSSTSIPETKYKVPLPSFDKDTLLFSKNCSNFEQ